MPDITITIPDAMCETITNLYGKDVLADFTLTAVEELLAWLNGEERPTSISELETQRIFAIYSRILIDLLPTADDIGQSFNLPMGRSRYIVQNLNYRHPEFMDRRRITTIIAALERNEKSDDGLPVAFLPKECEEFFFGIATELVLKHLITSVPAKIRLLDSVRVEMGKNDRDPFLKRLGEELKKHS